MSQITDPMNALLSLQQEFGRGMPVQDCELDKDYKLIYDEPNGRQRFSYAKIVRGNVQALCMFAVTDPVDGVACFNIGYAVSEKYRGLGLGAESISKGVAELKYGFGRAGIREFYIESVVGVNNSPSINISKKYFGDNGRKISDHVSGEPALHFRKLVKI